MININPGNNWQTVHDANPSETLFVVKTGTHLQQNLNPRAGITAQIEAGVVADGQNAKAFCIKAGSNAITNVKIIGPTTGTKPVIQNYNPPDRDGTISSYDPNLNAPGWEVSDIEVGFSGLTGAAVGTGGDCVRLGDTSKILRCFLHHADAYAFKVGEAGEVGYNEVAFSGHAQHGLNRGGTKIDNSTGVWIHHNNLHDNGGNALWFDIRNLNYLVECNEMRNNAKAAIMVEISYGGIIRNNLMVGNGFTGNGVTGQSGSLGYDAAVHLSQVDSTVAVPCEVYGNKIYGNWKGVFGSQQNRTDAGPPNGLYWQLINIYVHDNEAWHLAGGHSNRVMGVLQGSGAPADPAAAGQNNRFENNIYRIADSFTAPFTWSGTKTFAAWQGVGQDNTGSNTPFPSGSPPAEPVHPCGAPPPVTARKMVRRARFTRGSIG